MRVSQTALEAERAARLFDEDVARARLAELDGAEGKQAEAERRFLERRLARLEDEARQAAKLDELGPEDVAALVRR